MSGRYAALPNYPPVPDAERELADAFESDDEDEGTELTPLTQALHNTSAPAVERPEPPPGTYDFERDYDYPPPGSPPRPSALALPNDFGNSNGQLPSSPIRGPPAPRPSFLRRALGGILPTHYAPVPSADSGTVRVGGGVENDGVFANVMAKPARARAVTTENGEIHMVPEDSMNEAPPTYLEAQADTVPPYWETTVHAPGGIDGSDLLVDDLPTGSLFVFAANLFISFFFQFVGFLLTYLLHTSHAAKFGSRAGLGLTLIQYGFYSRINMGSGAIDDGQGNEGLGWPPIETDSSGAPLLSTSPTPTPTEATAPTNDEAIVGGVSSREWLSFLLMTIGWFLLLSSVIGYWRVKHWENSIRSSQNRGPVTPEDIEREVAIRRNIEQVFGIGLSGDSDGPRRSSRRREESGHSNPIPDQQRLDDERLTRDLRAAGLL